MLSKMTPVWCSLKIMMGPAPHTQLDADLAAGMGMPDNGPKLMSMWSYELSIFGSFFVFALEDNASSS